MDNALFDFMYSHDDGKAVPKGAATLSSNGYCCIQLKYTAILINGYSKLIMWTVIVSLYMQNL